jgi:hypothetical protein
MTHSTPPINTYGNPIVNDHFPTVRFIISNNLIVNKGKQHYWKAYTESGKVILIPITILEK